jgi:[histone H3]-lysine36 N-dimethyltransferase SETMAR
MGKKIDPKVEARINELSKKKYSESMIVKTLKSENVAVSKSLVHNVIKNVGERRQAATAGLPPPVKRQPRKVATRAVIRKVDALISKRNPPTQRQIAKTVKVSKTTVGRIIRWLKKNIRRKTRVHKLLPRHIQNRRTTCRNLYEKVLAGRKCEFVVTLDEAMFGLHNTNGERKICYLRKGQDMPENWVVDRDNFFKTFMVVGAISGRGTLPLIRVPKNVKVNAEYYINSVLRPLLEREVPKLYAPNELAKVVVHHDQAASHTAKKTTMYANDLKGRTGITILSKEEIPVKSPDISPLDFFGFGYLKRQLFKHRPTTQNGVWKVLKREWSKIDQALIDRTFESWKRRLRLVVQKSGHHIENTKDIHRRFR